MIVTNVVSFFKYRIQAATYLQQKPFNITVVKVVLLAQNVPEIFWLSAYAWTHCAADSAAQIVGWIKEERLHEGRSEGREREMRASGE